MKSTRRFQSPLHLDNICRDAAKFEETRRSTLRKPGLRDGLLKIRVRRGWLALPLLGSDSTRNLLRVIADDDRHNGKRYSAPLVVRGDDVVHSVARISRVLRQHVAAMRLNCGM